MRLLDPFKHSHFIVHTLQSSHRGDRAQLVVLTPTREGAHATQASESQSTCEPLRQLTSRLPAAKTTPSACKTTFPFASIDYELFNMWSTIRIAAARQLRVGGALSVSRLASRVATKQSSFAIPSRYRFQLGRRGFADVAGQPAKAITTKKAAAKKPAKGAKKVASKKAAPKKTVAKKAAPKKRVRKVLSEEDAKKQKVRELKRVALLKEPVRLPDKSWLVYVSQHTKGTHTEGEALGDRAKQLSESYKNLPASEVEVCPVSPRDCKPSSNRVSPSICKQQPTRTSWPMTLRTSLGSRATAPRKSPTLIGPESGSSGTSRRLPRD